MGMPCKNALASPAIQPVCVRFWSILTCLGFGLCIYYGIKVVLPAARAVHFQKTECFVNYSTFDGEAICACVLSYTQKSCYPCLKIYVEFTPEMNEKLSANGSKHIVKSILHQDLWSIGEACTFSPPSCCSHSKAENTRQVRDYMEKNAKNGSWINCHYNRLNHTEVTAALGNYKLSIFMALFWPLLLIVIGFSFTKYLKKITPQSGTKIKRDDTRRMLILSTMTAFLMAALRLTCRGLIQVLVQEKIGNLRKHLSDEVEV